MEYYSVVIFIAIFIMAILILLVMNNDLLKPYQKKLIFIAAGIVILASICEWLGVFLNGSPLWTKPIHYIVKVIEFSIAPLLPVVCASVIIKVKRWKIILPLAGVHSIIEIFSAIFGFVFFIDSNNIYTHGNFYWIYILAYVSGALYFIFHVFKRSTKQYGVNKFILVLLVFFLVSGVIIQLFISDIRVDWLCASVDVLLVYILYSELMQQTDAITKLLNRRSFQSRTSSIKGQAVVLYFDIDNFKGVNDTYGHNYGDHCLGVVGSILRKTFIKVGRCYRVGGDEFTAIINISIDQVDSYINNFERLIAEQIEKDPQFPTISSGYALFDSTKESINEAFKNADEMMYDNKTNRKSK